MSSRLSHCHHRHSIALALLAFWLSLPAVADVQSEQGELQNMQLLFVQSASSGSYDGQRLVLNQVGPTLFFSDPPFRVEGHMSALDFNKNWAEGEDSFSNDPPNAVLSILSEGATDNVTVELLDPILDGTTVSYAVEVLDDSLPERFGTASLFIDHHNTSGYIAAGLGGLVGGYGLAKLTDKQKKPKRPKAPPPAY